MVAKELSVNAKTKNTSKYEYFPGCLLCLKKTHNLQATETPKKAKK